MDSRMLIASLALGLAACGSPDRPCASCPNLVGTYGVTLTASGGTPTPGCDALGASAPRGQLILSQLGSALDSSYSGFSLSGTLFESGHLALSGVSGTPTGATESLTVDAVYTAEPDMTSLLVGSMTLQSRGAVQGTNASGTATCVLTFTFSAVD